MTEEISAIAEKIILANCYNPQAASRMYVFAVPGIGTPGK